MYLNGLRRSIGRCQSYARLSDGLQSLLPCSKHGDGCVGREAGGKQTCQRPCPDDYGAILIGHGIMGKSQNTLVLAAWMNGKAGGLFAWKIPRSKLRGSSLQPCILYTRVRTSSAAFASPASAFMIEALICRQAHQAHHPRPHPTFRTSALPSGNPRARPPPCTR